MEMVKLTKRQKELVEALRQGAAIHKPVLGWQTTHSVQLCGRYLMTVQRATLDKLEACGVLCREDGRWKLTDQAP